LNHQMLQNDLQEHHPTTYAIIVKSLSVKKNVFFGRKHIKELPIQRNQLSGILLTQDK
jgi:hypothetical protein